jgi:hypothetical protein
MASVNDYLKKLLYQYDCVVVPELGAFLTHYQSATFTEINGLYQPPRKRVAFNEALRLDDGILANYIMLHEPVTREGAQRHISQFVAELRQQVEKSGRFDIDGLGAFTRNDEGRLQFEPSLRHNFFGEAYGMSAVAVQLVNRALQPEPAIEAVPVTALGPALGQDEEVSLTPLRPSRPYWRVAAAALLIGSLGAVSYFSVIKPGEPLQSSLDPSRLFHTSASLVKRAVAMKETPKDDVSISPKAAPVTVPVAPVAVKKTEPVPVKPVIVETKAPATSAPTPAEIKVAPVNKVVTDPKVTVAPVVKPVRTGTHYMVIAGVFLSKQNALRLRRQLRKAGYADAYVILPHKDQKEVYKVAAVGSPMRSEAVANLDSISKLAGAEAWIFEY